MTDALVDRIVDGVIADALAGLNDWATYAEAQAKHYAPVRRVFYGSRNPETQFPRGQTRGGKPIIIATESAMQLYKASRRRQRRVVIPGESRLGEANSFNPVFSRGKRRVTGLNDTFRRVERDPGGRARLARIEAVETRPGQGPRRFLSPHVLGDRRDAQRTPDQRFSAKSELNYRGRYEMSAKAGGRAIFKDSQGRETLGGRLRGEIHIETGRREGDTYWVYVVSPTPYAKFMEFGTRHNRAHPFLRPALYDASRRTNIVRRAIRLGRRI